MSAPDGLRALVGLDGGATSAKACRVALGAEGLLPCGAAVEVAHVRLGAFTPVPREQADREPLAPHELELGGAWLEAAMRAVLGAVGGGSGVLLGVAMPGLKTPDRQGIAWARHGPRIPALLPRLEQELARAGIELVAPAAGLYSDGDCCGWGERHAAGGLMRGVHNAWYLGAGTGLAEALLLDGEPQELDALAAGSRQVLELEWRAGLTFEDLLSMRGLNARAGGAVEQREDTAQGRATLAEAGEALAELAARRARDVEAFGHGPLERVVLGQRLGLLLAQGQLQPLREALGGALEARGLPRQGWVVPSRLREAPALGAAARALAAWEAARG